MKNTPFIFRKKGFTLVEILFVVAIIAILAGIIFINGGDARKMARDKAKIQTIKQIQLALNTYYERHGKYPCGDSAKNSPGPHGGELDCSGSGPSFINGRHEGSASWTTGECNEADNEKEIEKGLVSDGLYNQKPDFGSSKHLIGYVISSDRQQYVLTTVLEKDRYLMGGDGGRCFNYYEVGPYKDDLINVVNTENPLQHSYFKNCTINSLACSGGNWQEEI